MRTVKLSLCLLALAVIGSPLFAGGGSAKPAGGDSAPLPISIFLMTHGRTFKADESSVLEVERLTNTKLDVVFAADGNNSLNLLFASGDLPDIVEFGGTGFQEYISTGYLRPLDDLLKNQGPNVLKSLSPDGKDLMTIQGKIYAIPYENNKIKHYAYVRTDWLKNVGIDLSRHKDYGTFGGKVITLDEYKDIAIKFTRNDPDKNGKNDTYGIGAYQRKTNGSWTNIYGAFGGIPGHYYIINGKATPWIVTDQFRQGVAYLASLWKEGAIDPEVYLANNDQAKQKMINSVAGSGLGEWWSYASGILNDGLRALHPEADFIPLWLTSNDGKIAGAPDNGLISNSYSITTQCKNPERVMTFLDYLNTDDGWRLVRMGVEGVDYNMVNGFPVRTDEGLVKYNNMTLDSLYPLSNRNDLYNILARRPVTAITDVTTQKWEVLAQDNTQPSYTSAFYGIPNPTAYAENGVDVNNWIEQSAMSFITGETPLTDANWNNYINTWKRMGGVKILQGYIDNYNKLKGTKITAGITE